MSAPSVTVTINQEATDRLTEQHLVRVANRIVNGAKIRANVDTGLMRSTIQFRLTGQHPPTGEVVARTRYAKFVHDGTRFYTGNPFLVNAARDVIR